VHACDIDPAAVRCARVNARRYGFVVHRADWFKGLPQSLRGRFWLVIAHQPYVPTAEVALLPSDYRAVEPAIAVDGGPDGLDPWRAVTAQCSDWLRPDGHLLTQVASHQGDAASAVAAALGLSSRLLEYDDSSLVDVQTNARP
jgi:release factor glutamine methyltransferase